MEKDKSFRMRVSEEELERWEAEAGKMGISVAELVRRRMEVVVEERWEAVKPARKAKVREADPADEYAQKHDLPAGKACIHGTAKGWNCWKCGGLALVDKSLFRERAAKLR
jgi:hypothetical protein